MFAMLGRALKTAFKLLLTYAFLVLLSLAFVLAVEWMLLHHTLEVPEGAVLVVNLHARVSDTPPAETPSQMLQRLQGEEEPDTIALRAFLETVRRAAGDDRIQGIFLHGNLREDGWLTSFATLREMRATLAEFRRAGKPVVAYQVNPSLRDYYLCSAADELFLNPFGILEIKGLASELPFFGRALQKYGIGLQTTIAGKYKSALETFTREDLSPESREADTALLEDLWAEIREGLAEDRALDPEDFQEFAQTHPFLYAEEALAEGLVDRVGYFDEVLVRLEELGGRDEAAQTFRQVAYAEYAADTLARAEERAAESEGPSIAVVYAEGEIVNGRGDPDQVGGDALGRRLRELRKDDEIDAVVLRVNSPGGSAQASEIILRELRLLHETKPVVVSMGGVAASGGYWIAMESDYIFAHPSTITGSIGVLGALPHVEDLAGRIGITFDGVKTAPMADLYTFTRPKTEAEMRILQGFTDRIYAEFKDRVARNRQLLPDRVEEIAQGRVWSGADALAHDLVDAPGGLSEAIAEAARLIGTGDRYAVRDYPREKHLREVLLELLGGGPGASLPAGMPEAWQPWARDLGRWPARLDPRGLYLRLPYDLRLY